MQALMYAAPMLGLIGLGVAGIGLVGRDPHAGEHDLADYHDPEPARPVRPGLHPSRRDWPLVDVDERPAGRRRLRARAMADLILPPIPADTTVGLPLYAEQVVAEQLRAQYGTTDRGVIARLMLREAAAEQRAQLAVSR